MASPSTSDLSGLPEPEPLRRICKAMAALDAVLQADEWMRYHSYFPVWAESVQLAKVDNGAGDTLFCFFSPAGTVIRGFDHESPVSPHAQEQYQIWPGIYEGLPAPLSVLLDDPAFDREEVTFCLWRAIGGTAWEKGPIQTPADGDDGSSFLFGLLFATAEDYIDWAKTHYSAKIPLEPVQRVYERLTLDEEAARRINPSSEYEAVRQEIQSILG